MREEEQGIPTDNPEPVSIWKQMRSAESLVEKEEPEFKVDLRIEGIAQDVILKDEERMGNIQEVVDNLRKGSYTTSFQEDLRKLYDGQRGIQSSSMYRASSSCTNWDKCPACHSCFKHLPEGLVFCSCGKCLRLDETTIKRIRARF